MQERSREISQRIVELRTKPKSVLEGIQELTKVELIVRSTNPKATTPRNGFIEVLSTPKWNPPSREELLQWKKDNRSAIRSLGQPR